MALTQAVFTADDFGRTSSINAAIIRAHQEGVVTSASLMVTGEAFREAVILAGKHPKLAVGLHLVCADGRAALPASEIPHLVDGAGRFPTSPTQAGLRYFFSSEAQEELARELAAQFELFAGTGLPLSHVDGHYHLHVHPSIFPLVAPLAERYGARGLRLPRDDLRLGLTLDKSRPVTKVAWAASHALLCQQALRWLRGSRLVVADKVFGLLQSGDMHERYVLGVIERSEARRAEFYFHPDLHEHPEDPYGPNPHDLATLLSPRLRQALEAKGVRLTTYPELSSRTG